MSAQVIQLDRHDEVSKTAHLPKEGGNGEIVTMGTVIGMIHMVMGAIIDAIEKSGKTARTYLQSNLKAIVDAAEHIRLSGEKNATGMKSGALISMAVAGVGLGAGLGAVGRNASNASKMKDVQNTPIGQPSLGNGSAIEMSVMSKPPASVAQGAQASQANVSNVKAIRAELPKTQGKTFASEAEKNREIDIMKKEMGSNPWDSAQAAANAMSQPAGQAENARYQEAAAREQYGGQVLQGIKDSIASQRSETERFFDSLPAQIDKLGVAQIVMETIKAATQWR